MMTILSRAVGLLILFLSTWYRSSDSFTRSFRSVPILFNGSTINWDLVLEPVGDFTRKYCQSNCDEIEISLANEVDNQLHNQRIQFYNSFLSRMQQDEHTNWVGNADSETQKSFFDSSVEIFNIRNGLILPRSYCNNRSHVMEDSSCLYFQLCKEYGVSGTRLSTIGLIDSIADNLYGLSMFAENLFNSQWYDHAEALSIYILDNLIPSLSSYHLPTEMHLDILQTTQRLYMIICETEKLRGNLAESTTFALSIIHTARKASILTDNKIDEKKAYIHILRSILTTPSIPSSTEISAAYRTEIEDDLIRFLALITSKEVTVPLSYLTDEVSATPFYMAHQGLNDHRIQGLLYQVFTTLSPEFSFTSPYLLPPTSPASSFHFLTTPSPMIRPLPRYFLAPIEEIRLGFVSSHFFDHSIGRILIELIRMMASITFALPGHSVIRFRVFVYFLDMRYDQSTRTSSVHDAVTAMFESSMNITFVRLPCAIKIARERIAEDRLDALIYADLGMDFTSYVLAYARLAPLQIAWWGHPITSGLPSIDYFFSLEDEIPSAQSHYSEQLVRMKYINSVPLRKIYEHSAADKQRVYERLQFPPSARIAVILGRFFKLHPDNLSLLMDTIAYLDTQHTQEYPIYVVLFVERLNDFNEIIYARLVALAVEKGLNVSRMLQYIKLLSYRDYYHKITPYARVVLDTYPYGGCITTHDALHMGTPVVTMPSQYIRGRFTMSMYKQMEHTELILSVTERSLFMEKVTQLLLNDSYYQAQSQAIQYAFQHRLLQNSEVAWEWSTFLLRAIQQ